MAYPMQAQAPKQPPYPPYGSSAASPPGQTPFAPPAKRQRLSPDPRSPANNSPVYAQSPVYGNYGHSPIQSPYSQPYASPQGSFNTPQQYSPPAQQWFQQQQQQQTPYQNVQLRPNQISPPPSSNSHLMPPPPRPKEDKDEKIGVDDIGDSLFGSGINLKDEENYLHNTWNNRHSQNESFQTNSTSFGSNGSSGSNSYSYLTQNTSFSSQGQGIALAGTMGQPLSQEAIENEAKRKRENAARKQAEQQQYHLNNQYLQGNCVRNRMHKIAQDNGVRLDINGVYVRNPETQPNQPYVMVNGSGTEGITAVKNKPEAMIESGVSYEHMLTLLSLASQERMRGLLDDAYGLARARRYGDHGRVVPVDFADISDGPGQQSQETVVAESLTGSQWDKPAATSIEAVNGAVQTNGAHSTPSPGPMQTVAYQGSLHIKLRELAESDMRAEKERLRKREARKRNAESGDGTTPIDTTSDVAAEPLAIVAPVKPLTKKEQNKKNKEAAAHTEAQALNQSNQTAAMMALGGKKNRYSWMSGGSANVPTNRFAKPGSGTVTPKGQPEPTKGPAEPKKVEEKKAPTWGDWREDDVHGKGIELRDLILVLERDGKEKRMLAKAIGRLPLITK